MRHATFFALLVGGSLMLAGCGNLGMGAPTALPTVVLGGGSVAPQSTQATGTAAGGVTSGGGATASGEISPAQLAEVAAPVGSTLQTLDVAVGKPVKAGQALATLSGSEKLEAALEAAKLEVLSAEQAEKTLKDNAAQALSTAQVRLADAQKALDNAQKRREARQYRNGSQSQIDAARANYLLANDTYKTAQATFDDQVGASDDNLAKAAALSELSTARAARDKALANLNYLLAMPNAIDVGQAEATLKAAQAEVDAAQKQYDALKSGPDPDALALAEQQRRNAEAQATAAEKALADLTLKAPFDGTVSKINVQVGDWLTQGETVLVVADLDHLQVETKDLSERSVAQVKVGEKASVLVKALGMTLDGVVKEVAPLADTLGGDVVYKTVITLDNQPEDLRSGMSVDVTFEGE
jgi:HlyD family secretion protein